MAMMGTISRHARLTKTSVTNFLHVGDEYLFMMRSSLASINASELNGIGGKLESGENYIGAAIRETEEETGYKVSEKDIQFCGIIKFECTDGPDWLTCFYKIAVDSKVIPIGHDTREGKLMWIHKDNVFKSSHVLVDDLQYIWKYIVSGNTIFFANAKVEGKEFKIINVTMHTIAK